MGSFGLACWDNKQNGVHLSDEAKPIARALTLRVLDKLDERRKAHVITFLAEASLINCGDSITEQNNSCKPQILLDTANLTNIVDLTNLSDLHSGLISTDLRKAKLNGIKLDNVDLSYAKLQRAIIKTAALQKANLTGADLTGADLTDADLTDANLSKAKLPDDFERKVISIRDACYSDKTVPKLDDIKYKKYNLRKIQETDEECKKT